MQFLNNHAHKDTVYKSEGILDKMASLQIYSKREETVSQKFGLSINVTEGSLRSVTQQLEIWESGMKASTDKEGKLFTFVKSDEGN